MATKIIDLKENPPTSIPNLTKYSMGYYIRDYGTKEDKAWFVNLCKTHTKVMQNNLTKEMIETLDISFVRREFAKRFFPFLLEEKKAKSKAQSFNDFLDTLLED